MSPRDPRTLAPGTPSPSGAGFAPGADAAAPVSLRVNDVALAASGTVLEACRAAGAAVPAFCHDDRVRAGGHCRACMVEMDGRMVAACTTRVREGAQVFTDTERLREYRRDLGELMVSESSPRGHVAKHLEAWQVDGSRYGRAALGHWLDRSHPYLRIDLDACILCRRCVRACEEIQGQFVFAVEGRGSQSRLAWGAAEFADSACVSCGACVTACPTGAISDVDRDRAAEPITGPNGVTTRANGGVALATRTTCGYCGVGCQLAVHGDGARIHHIDGVGSSPVNHGHLCVKGRYAHGFVRHPERLRAPLVRRDGRLVETTWDDALGVIAREFARLRGHLAGLSSSRCTNEENYLFQKWFRGGLGTNDVDCCARVCHAPSAAGMRESLGTGAATNSLADIERADLLLVIGANVTAAHPVTGARIRNAALRGVPLVVIDPRVTELAEIAEVHLQVRPGANVPLLNALACVLVEDDLVDRAFVEARTEGWEAFEKYVRRFTPESVEAATGVPATLVRRAAHLYGRAKRPMAMHGLGVTEHFQGSEAVMLICNLALLAGAIGREGVGVNPLRGQNNVQGAADMGCQPDLLTGYQPVADPAVRARFGAAWGRALPERPGRTLPRIYEAIRAGDIKGMFVFGEDVVQTDPDTNLTRETLAKLEFLAVQELFLSETAKLAHVVLPAASFLEKDGTFTNGERRVQRVRRVVAPLEGTKPDWEILLALMEATGWKQPFTGPSQVMDEIASLSPALAGVSYARLDGDGLQWPVPSADHPGTPILHAETFPRGRAQLACVEWSPSPSFGTPLTLVTGRALEHYNAGTMTRRTGNVEIVPDDSLEISPADAAARGIVSGHRVRVKSAQGETVLRAAVTNRVAAGTVFTTFHFPEACVNLLTSEVRDRLCDCPEYKVTAVEVESLK